MRVVFAAAIAASLLAGPLAAQQVYKWVDQDGTVHFTDSPPDESVGAERVVLRGSVSTTITQVEQRGMTADEVDLLYTPDQRIAACRQARANQETLRVMPVVTMDKDGDGTAEELTEEEKAEQLERSAQQVELLCREEDNTG